MTAVLGFDTATPDTVVALALDGREPEELRHTPGPGVRCGNSEVVATGVRTPSLARNATIRSAAAWPTACPATLAGPSPIVASDAA